MKLSVMGLFAELSINDTNHNETLRRVLSAVMLSVVMLSVVAPNEQTSYPRDLVGSVERNSYL
jgi:hypothetical protein